MSLKLNCDRCKKKIVEPGALVFSSPGTEGYKNVVRKYHICKECEPDLIDWVDHPDTT